MNRGRRVGLDRALGAGDGACEPKRGMGRPPRGLLESIVRSAPVLGLGVLKRRLEFPGRRSSFWRPVCLLCLTAPSRSVSEPTRSARPRGTRPCKTPLYRSWSGLGLARSRFGRRRRPSRSPSATESTGRPWQVESAGWPANGRWIVAQARQDGVELNPTTLPSARPYPPGPQPPPWGSARRCRARSRSCSVWTRSGARSRMCGCSAGAAGPR
jgi:hypothetical protein